MGLAKSVNECTLCVSSCADDRQCLSHGPLVVRGHCLCPSASTQIVGSDGQIPGALVKALSTNKAFAAAEHIQGTHYPCSRDQSAAFWEISPKQTYIMIPAVISLSNSCCSS